MKLNRDEWTRQAERISEAAFLFGLLNIEDGLAALSEFNDVLEKHVATRNKVSQYLTATPSSQVNLPKPNTVIPENFLHVTRGCGSAAGERHPPSVDSQIAAASRELCGTDNQITCADPTSEDRPPRTKVDITWIDESLDPRVFKVARTGSLFRPPFQEARRVRAALAHSDIKRADATHRFVLALVEVAEGKKLTESAQKYSIVRDVLQQGLRTWKSSGVEKFIEKYIESEKEVHEH